MRILIIHQYLWSHYKGKIYSELQKIVNEHKKDELLVLQTSLNEITRANLGPVDRSIHQYNYQVLVDDYYENIPNTTRAKKMLYWVRKFKPDVVNVSGYYEAAMNSVIFYCRLKGIKVIISVDSTEDDKPNIWWKEAVKRFVVNRAHGFFCYGSKAAEYMLKFGVKQSQILLENNAVDNQKISAIYQEAYRIRETEKKNYGLRPYNFIYTGRLMAIKNVNNLIIAFSKLKAENWGLIILGDGVESENLKKYVADNQIDGVKFIEGQAWYNVPRFMALGDVFVLPSYSEPWGLVVNEAMVGGMPVIVSNKCGSSHDLVVNGKNGYTFNPYDTDELATVMERFVQEPEKIEVLGKISKEIIRKYSPERVGQEMYAGFKKVLYEHK
ncbi:glycosyltransferase [Emticicia sp. BO119]|uniref:glycosyltransferase n=1 Tax=Emticicia sp. BO119 TaxID=2757768 RepID=UPI0015F09C99|nr:glycosyltransferase [Emticicia sp. BO119]MBA4850068.1 glycosyltransferase [Emticicia sp. BO119]